MKMKILSLFHPHVILGFFFSLVEHNSTILFHKKKKSVVFLSIILKVSCTQCCWHPHVVPRVIPRLSFFLWTMKVHCEGTVSFKIGDCYFWLLLSLHFLFLVVKRLIAFKGTDSTFVQTRSSHFRRSDMVIFKND